MVNIVGVVSGAELEIGHTGSWAGPDSARGARDCFLSRLSIVTNEVVFDALQFVIDIDIIVNTSPAPGQTQLSVSHFMSSLHRSIHAIY